MGFHFCISTLCNVLPFLNKFSVAYYRHAGVGLVGPVPAADPSNCCYGPLNLVRLCEFQAMIR